MKILIVHNRYRSDQPSGENDVVDRQIELLTAAGHEVMSFERNSDEIATYGGLRKLTLPGRVVWSQQTRNDIARALEQDAPDVIHVHNTFPLITPSVLAPCARVAPTVVSLHNYRTLCAHGQLLRRAKPCEDCVGRVPWRGVLHGCYRESRLATAPTAIAIQMQRLSDVWNRHATVFIALSAFASTKLVEGGFDGQKLRVLPNFGPRPSRVRTGPGKYFVFLGRLSVEKDPELLVRAWNPAFGELRMIGDGPLRDSVEALAAHHGGGAVRVLGREPHERAMELLADARALIISSCGYEAGPLILAEAFARGVPVIAPDLGAFGEIVEDDVTGRLFRPADSDDLVRCVEDLGDDDASLRMGLAALDEYERLYTPESYLERLLAIYEHAQDVHAKQRSETAWRSA